MSHLTDAQIQAVADGSLRGPEGFAAREHCDACSECGAELALYEALAGQLSSLQDPVPPPDFTAQVLAAVEVREVHLATRRQTLLAALPAAAVAVFAVVGWALSSAPAAHVDALVTSATVLRHVFGVIAPVVETFRVAIGLSAFAVFAVVLSLLQRTLQKPTPRAAS